MRRFFALLLVTALAGLPSVPAVASPADLSLWTAVSYPGDGSPFGMPGEWLVSADGTTVAQHVNGAPTFFVAPDAVEGKRVTATFTSTSDDNDFFGVALGFDPTEISDPDAEYLLIDWKQSEQSIDWIGGGGPVTGSTGLAVSRVTGVPSLDELWGHVEQTEAATGAVVELERAVNLGDVGWEDDTPYALEIEYTETSLIVEVDGVVELDMRGDFPPGPFAIYNFSQPGVASSAITFEPLNEPPEVLGGGAADVTVDEGEVATTSGAFTDPDGDPLTLSCSGSCSGFSDLGAGAWTLSRVEVEGPDVHFVTVTASDGELEATDDFMISVANVVPVIDEPLTVAPPIVAVGDPVEINVSFTDAGVLDTHTAAVSWGDGEADLPMVDQGAGFGTASATHAYVSAGTKSIEVTITDDDDGVDTAIVTVFVFDPDTFVTGGGWIASPEGAVADAPDHEGKATFGFVVRYDRSGAIRGSLEFQVHKEINLHARDFDHLEIVNGVARFSGTGAVNGEPGYEFSAVATDERIAATDEDLFRIAISIDGAVVYDGAALGPVGLPIVGKGIQVHQRG